MTNTEPALAKTKHKPAAKPRKSLVRGLVAGLAGGLAGAVAMTVAEHFLSLAPGKSAAQENQPGAQVLPPEKAVAVETVRWGFGAAVGAAYGLVAEYYPAATSRQGAAFGMTLETLSRKGTLPALGFLVGPSARPPAATASGSAAGMTSHVVYGVTTEVVRSFIRKRL